MISQSIVTLDNKVLMVKQYVERGDIVWNFPGGGIHESETPEEACIRETKEETGYDIEVIDLTRPIIDLVTDDSGMLELL